MNPLRFGNVYTYPVATRQRLTDQFIKRPERYREPDNQTKESHDFYAFLFRDAFYRTPDFYNHTLQVILPKSSEGPRLEVEMTEDDAKRYHTIYEQKHRAGEVINRAEIVEQVKIEAKLAGRRVETLSDQQLQTRYDNLMRRRAALPPVPKVIALPGFLRLASMVLKIERPQEKYEPIFDIDALN